MEFLYHVGEEEEEEDEEDEPGIARRRRLSRRGRLLPPRRTWARTAWLVVTPRCAPCCLIADASQCHKTKSQWQAWRRVASAGVTVKLATGHSVREAYVQDGRGPGGLKGLHHAKALLLVGETTAELVVGSLNWTTSSKANSERGVQLSLASNAPVVTDFCREFDRVFGSAERLEDANPPGVKPAAVSSGAAQGSAPPTATI